MEYWKVIKDKSKDYWLEVEDPDGWYSAIVKWDGCVHYNKVANEPLPITGNHPQLVDYIHYCDLDDEIERLKSLRDIAEKYFNKEDEC